MAPWGLPEPSPHGSVTHPVHQDGAMAGGDSSGVLHGEAPAGSSIAHPVPTAHERPLGSVAALPDYYTRRKGRARSNVPPVSFVDHDTLNAVLAGDL